MSKYKNEIQSLSLCHPKHMWRHPNRWQISETKSLSLQLLRCLHSEGSQYNGVQHKESSSKPSYEAVDEGYRENHFQCICQSIFTTFIRMVLVSTLLIYNSDSNISFILPWIKTWESETGFWGYKLRSWLRIILSYMSLNHYCMGIYEIKNQIIIISIQNYLHIRYR